MNKVAEALRGTNYSEIARKSRTTPGFVSMLFRGKRRGKWETMARVAKVLGVSLDELHAYLSKVSKAVAAPTATNYGWGVRKSKGKTTAPAGVGA